MIINDNNIINKLIKINLINNKMKNNSSNYSNNLTSFTKNFHFEEDTLSRIQREFNKLKHGIMIGHNFMNIASDFKLLE